MTPRTLRPNVHRYSTAGRLVAVAGHIVNELHQSTPPADWPQAADRELLTIVDLLTGAGLDPVSVLPSDVIDFALAAAA